MINKWRILEKKELVRDQWLHLSQHRCQRHDGSIIDPYYVISGADWVNIMPLTKKGRVLLIREYRHGYGDVLIGLPGGLIDKGETPDAAAVRELREETGLFPLAPPLSTGKMIVNPSTHTNVGYSFVAIVDDAMATSASIFEPDIELFEMDLIDLFRAVLDGSLMLSGYDVASILRGIFFVQKNEESNVYFSGISMGNALNIF
ncbi:NUDIX hydrolase [Cupriavidus sp. 2TAF22]|uniref:NUDIX hydrolase n=1 Tax=unclassified Cupriavidus TaxID=2640874 RepID=UPI003F8F7F9D